MTDRIQMVQHLADLEAKRREHGQQNPRPARVHFVTDVRGAGETRLRGRKAINFGAFLLEEPIFTSGCVLLSPVATGELPQCTALVTRWLKNENGMYTGAEMAFYVDCPRADVQVRFCLTFEAATLRSTAGATVNG